MTIEKVTSHPMGTAGQIRDKASLDRLQGPGTPAAPETEGFQEEVQISSQAKGMAKIIALVKQLPEARSERLDELKRQVESGTYQAPAIEVARKMLAEEL